MMRKTFFTLSLLTATIVSFGQTPTPIHDEEIQYDLISDDPSQAISRWYVGLEPIFFDINGTNGFAMGFGGYTHFQLKQNLMFQARFQTPYWKFILDGTNYTASQNRKESDETQQYFNDFKPAKLFYFDFTVSAKLLRWDRPNRPMKIYLGTGGTDLNNYIDGVSGTKRYQLMLRAGLLTRQSTIKLDGTIPGTESWARTTNNPYTNMYTAVIYAGASFNKIWEMKANITELDIGKKIARMHRAVYVDLMFAPVLNIKSISDGTKEVDIVAKNDGDLSNGYIGKNRFGFRIGRAQMPEYKNNLSGFEIGIYPSFTSKDRNLTGGYWKWWWIIDLYSSEKS